MPAGSLITVEWGLFDASGERVARWRDDYGNSGPFAFEADDPLVEAMKRDG